MEHAALKLFARPALTLAGAPVDFVAERRFQVLALFAVRNDWVSRDQLASLFWPDQSDAAARTNVRKVLFRIKESLPDVCLEMRGADVRWLIDSDAQQLLRASAAQRWDEVADLYRGPLLEGIDDAGFPEFGAWLGRERQRFFEHARTAMLAQITLATAAHDYCKARDVAERLLQHDPLDESALIAWCEAQTALGETESAQRRYREFTRQIADELGVEPSDRLRALAQAWRAAPTTARLVPPAALDCFIGRRQEAAELQALLTRPECRLISIVGPGGVGKSRFLREALPALQRQLELPAFWLPLEDLSTTEEIPARVSTLLQLKLPQQGSIAERLIALLGEPPRLLALDNAEHLSELAPLLLKVASALPNLRIVLSTRSRLRVTGEWVLPLAGLPVPDADSRDQEAAITFDAVRLFIDRARQANPAFAPADISDVIDIVQRVDGLPLAIELAAAWTRLLPPREIAEELSNSLDLLAAEDGGTSVRAVIERSWNLLAPREREVLTDSSVFAGGFTPAMARRVCDAPLPVLASLTDKSLLNSEPEGRLTMHPLVHHVMRERGVRGPTWPSLQLRHCESYASWLHELLPQTQAAPSQTAQTIEKEHANCRTALQFAAATGNARLVQAMAYTMMLAFLAQTRFREGASLFVETLLLADEDAGCRAPLLHALATLRYRQGDLTIAEQFAREGLLCARRARDRNTLYRCLHTLALACHTSGDYSNAVKYFQPGVRRLRRKGDAITLRAFLNGLGMSFKSLGRLDDAAAIYDEALVLARSLGDISGAVALHNNLGNLYRARRDFRKALHYFDEGLALAPQQGPAWHRAFLLLNRGLALFELGDLPQSSRSLEQALVECRGEAQSQVQVAAHQGLARTAVRQKDFDNAQLHLARAGRLAYDGTIAASFATTMICAAEAMIARGLRLQAGVMLLWAIDHQLDHADLRLAGELLDDLALTEVERLECGTCAAACSELQLLAELESPILKQSANTAAASESLAMTATCC